MSNSLIVSAIFASNEPSGARGFVTRCQVTCNLLPNYAQISLRGLKLSNLSLPGNSSSVSTGCSRPVVCAGGLVRFVRNDA
jgi:hypothetical protein